MRSRRWPVVTASVFLLLGVTLAISPGCRAIARGVAEGIVNGLIHSDDDDDCHHDDDDDDDC